MTWFARAVAAVAVALAVLAAVAGQVLMATSMATTAMGLLSASVATRRQEAERQAAFAQRLRAARREPQGMVVVRRAVAGFPARFVPVWVDVDGEARARLAAGTAKSLPVSAGERRVVGRRPWSTGHPTQVSVPEGGTTTVEV